jgi:ABC-type polysaccharide/polyol phosphate transport system ATPase subunit
MDSERPVSIEVRGVAKQFAISGLREPPFKRLFDRSSQRSRTLQVLEDINFDVYQGEFFGIVGRNGSGKSTLLKLLASVYRADAGRIRVAGRLAPFLELGVGFDQQLPARENVILNAVMMGLSPAEAARRCDAVIDFAGLGDFTDLQLKNYSSGMKVRLAFAALTQVDADLLLLDEVLAVGDAEFRDKCETVFKRMRSEGRTIVLVTHSMATLNAECDRALLLHDGRIEALGGPLEISNRYLELSLRAGAEISEGEVGRYASRFADVIADPPIRIIDAWTVGLGNERDITIAERAPIEVHLLADVLRPIERPGFRIRIDDNKGQVLFRGGSGDLGLERRQALPGERLEISIRLENRLAPGNYVFAGEMHQIFSDGSSEPVTPVTHLRFEVVGDETDGLLSLESELTIRRVQDAPGAAARARIIEADDLQPS